MTPQKRIFDIALAIILIGCLAAPIMAIALVIAVKDGRPIFYRSMRMQTVDRCFGLIKFRTMDIIESDCGVTGGDKSDRITIVGQFLRNTHLDELPQLWNVLVGDMSFVGPRPPLRVYVERFPALYEQVLKSRPGITGLASLRYHLHEYMLLARCSTANETDAVYTRVCVPAKARLDLIYQRHQSLCFDMKIMLQTVFRTRGNR